LIWELRTRDLAKLEPPPPDFPKFLNAVRPHPFDALQRVKKVMDVPFATGDELASWFDENKNYLYWSDSEKRLVLDGRAKAAGRPLVDLAPADVDASYYWYAQGVGNVSDVRDEEEYIRGRLVDPEGGRERPFRVTKAAAGDRTAREQGYKRAIAFFVKLLADDEANPPGSRLRPEQRRHFMSRLQELTGVKLARPRDWVEWWKRNSEKLGLDASGKHVVPL